MNGADQERLDHELALVVENLSRAFSTVPAEEVRSAVDAAAASLVPQARVAAFLPVLIQRRARDRLRTRTHGETPP